MILLQYCIDYLYIQIQIQINNPLKLNPILSLIKQQQNNKMSTNKLSLKQFMKTDQKSLKTQLKNQKIQSAQQLIHEPLSIKKIKTKSQLKLNTQPCQGSQKQKQNYLFKSIWQVQSDQIQTQFKGLSSCQSPTFATEISSQANCPLKQNQRSNSKSKSKSIKKFIGQGQVGQHRVTNSVIIPNKYQQQNNEKLQVDLQAYYNLTNLQIQNSELKTCNKKLSQKYTSLKVKYDFLLQNKQQPFEKQSKLMSNQQLMIKMQSQSFWKFYIKAEKLIKISMGQNTTTQDKVINFMKELQALRQMSSLMKKQNKNYKENLSNTQEQLQNLKDKNSLLQANIQQMRLKCLAFQNTFKKMKHQYKNTKQQSEKYKQQKREFQIDNIKLKMQVKQMSKQISSFQQKHCQLKILYQQCDKQRLVTKKKLKSSQQQHVSLSKQLSSFKTQLNLIQLQKYQQKDNKKDLIQKQKLKERIYQLEKDVKTIIQEKDILRKEKEQELYRFNKDLKNLESQVKQLQHQLQQLQLSKYKQLQKVNDQKIHLMDSLKHYQHQNTCLSSSLQKAQEKFLQLNNLNCQLSQSNTNLQQKTSRLQSSKIKSQKQFNQSYKKEMNKLKDQIQYKDKLIQQGKDNHIKNGQIIQQLRKQVEYKQFLLQQKDEEMKQFQHQMKQFEEQVDMQFQAKVTQLQQQRQSICNEPPKKSAQQFSQFLNSLLIIKQQIIRKTLVFCPQQFRELIIDYIYHGDILQKQYINQFMSKSSSQQISQDQSSYEEDRILRTDNNQINMLIQEFVEIGRRIDYSTNRKVEKEKRHKQSKQKYFNQHSTKLSNKLLTKNYTKVPHQTKQQYYKLWNKQNVNDKTMERKTYQQKSYQRPSHQLNYELKSLTRSNQSSQSSQQARQDKKAYVKKSQQKYQTKHNPSYNRKTITRLDSNNVNLIEKMRKIRDY